LDRLEGFGNRLRRTFHARSHRRHGHRCFRGLSEETGNGRGFTTMTGLNEAFRHLERKSAG
jgi:hypothetical protein